MHGLDEGHYIICKFYKTLAFLVKLLDAHYVSGVSRIVHIYH